MPLRGHRVVALANSPRAHALLALAVGVTGLLVYAFPGFMSSDSAAQLADARGRNYTDWHPPAMAAVWTVLNAVVAGPALMLLLQVTLFLFGMYRLLCRVLSERAAAIVASAILLAPPVIAPMAVIWKDSQMAGFLVMGASLLLSTRRWAQIVGIVLLAIATAYRDNAAAATLPLLVMLYRTPRWPQRWAQIAIAVALWLGTVAAALAANKALTDVKQHAWYVSLGPSDIVGVLEKARPHSDAELLALLDGAPLVVRTNIQQHAQTYYNPTLWWWYMNGHRRMFDWPTTAEQRDVIARAWRSLVFGNPRAYFYHRLRVFRGVIAINDTPVFDPVWTTQVDLGRHGQADQFVEAKGIQKDIGDTLKWIAANTPLFRPYVYLALALVLVALGWRQRLVVALLASGLAYELALFFIAPSPDYRYSHWMVTCTIISAVIVTTERIRSVRRSGGARTVG